MESSTAGPLVTEPWLKQLREQLYLVPLTQLVSRNDAHRLVALALLVTLQAHRGLSDLGPAPLLRQALAQLDEKLAAADAIEAAPPDLAEMTLVLEIATVAMSQLEARRGACGVAENDVPTDDFAEGLVRLAGEACAAGGERAAASVRPLLREMVGGG